MATLIGSVVLPAAAYATQQGDSVPAGCYSVATGPYIWSPNCDVSESYNYGSHFVVGIQKMLNGLGISTGGVDGLDGTNTNAAIETFQRDEGLGVDGVVGSNTWQAFFGQLHFWRTVTFYGQSVSEYYTGSGQTFLVGLGSDGYWVVPWSVSPYYCGSVRFDYIYEGSC